MPEANDEGGNLELSGSDIDTQVVDTPSPETTETAPATETAETTETPAETTPAAQPSQELYELPDGRKVDAATLTKEWKENFLPDYTRKSQRLAEQDREAPPKNINNDQPEWTRPDYQPKSWAEVVEIAKKEAISDLARGQQQEAERIAAIEKQVQDQIAEIRAKDPKLDETALFQHANKYGFADLRKIALETEQRVLGNLKRRESDPVATGGGSPAVSDGIDPATSSMFESAQEFLARVKGK